MKYTLLVFLFVLALALLTFPACASKPHWTGSGSRAHHASMLELGPVTQRHWFIGSVQDRNTLRAAIYSLDRGTMP